MRAGRVARSNCWLLLGDSEPCSLLLSCMDKPVQPLQPPMLLEVRSSACCEQRCSHKDRQGSEDWSSSVNWGKARVCPSWANWALGVAPFAEVRPPSCCPGRRRLTTDTTKQSMATDAPSSAPSRNVPSVTRTCIERSSYHSSPSRQTRARWSTSWQAPPEVRPLPSRSRPSTQNS